MIGTLIIFPMSLFLFLLLSLSSLILILRWKSGQTRKKPIINPPGPKSYPIIGCLLSFYENRRRLLDWYTDMLSTAPTQTIVISRLGARRTIVTANPENIEYMLKTNFNNFPKGKPFTEMLGDFLGNGIFNVDGEMWSNQRKLIAHQFKVESLRQYVENELKDEVEKKLIPVLESAADARQGVCVDLQDLLRRVAFDLICKISLGFDPCCVEQHHSLMTTPHPLLEAFDLASAMSARRGAAPLSITWKIKRFFDMDSEKTLREVVARIHSFVENAVRDKKRSMNERVIGSSLSEDHDTQSDLLSKMVLGDGKEDGEMVRDTMISFILAGWDTTSAAMTWLFYLIARHPDAENEVVKELELVREDRGDEDLLRYESLSDLRWLKACICESMRLFPPVAWDSKHATSNDLLPDGTPVRAGDRVTFFPYGMGRMEEIWGKDRLEFKPERWISELQEDGRIKTLKNMSPYKFPIFQAGPRVCLGKEMAFVQMKYVVASILKRFRIQPVVDQKPVFVPLLTAHMAGGFKVCASAPVETCIMH